MSDKKPLFSCEGCGTGWMEMAHKEEEGHAVSLACPCGKWYRLEPYIRFSEVPAPVTAPRRSE